MAVLHTVHEPPAGLSTPAPSPLVIADGFSWLAFLLPPLWLAWHQLWFEIGCGAVILLVSAFVAALFPGSGQLLGWVWLALALLAGFEGRDWRRALLLRQGWRERPGIG